MSVADHLLEFWIQTCLLLLQWSETQLFPKKRTTWLKPTNLLRTERKKRQSNMCSQPFLIRKCLHKIMPKEPCSKSWPMSQAIWRKPMDPIPLEKTNFSLKFPVCITPSSTQDLSLVPSYITTNSRSMWEGWLKARLRKPNSMLEQVSFRLTKITTIKLSGSK